MSYYSRFYPFLRPYLPHMIGAAILVMVVALLNLALVRVAGILWDLITVQRNLSGMTHTIGLFLGVVLAQGCVDGPQLSDSMGFTTHHGGFPNAPVCASAAAVLEFFRQTTDRGNSFPPHE